MHLVEKKPKPISSHIYVLVHKFKLNEVSSLVFQMIKRTKQTPIRLSIRNKEIATLFHHHLQLFEIQVTN